MFTSQDLPPAGQDSQYQGAGEHPPVQPPTVMTANPSQPDPAQQPNQMGAVQPSPNGAADMIQSDAEPTQPADADTAQQLGPYRGNETSDYDDAAERAFQDLPPEQQLESLSSDLLREFHEAEQLRLHTEQRWLRDLRQFRGIYEDDVLQHLTNRSKSFVRRTRVKVVTTDSRMIDYLFPSGQEKNWTCTETPKPAVSAATRQMVAQQLQQKTNGQPPTDDQVDDAVLQLCKSSAQEMTKVIEDQLTEIRYKQITRKALHSGNLYGTGVVKGPLVDRKVRQRFFQGNDNTWNDTSEEYLVPFVEHVPLWRFYPDMNATELSQCRYVYERHTMTYHEMSLLAGRKSFNGQVIRDFLIGNPRGAATPRYFDNELKTLGEREGAQSHDSGMYEVLERWGWLTGQQLATAGIKIEDGRLLETFFANVWLLPTGQIIKAVLQPINGVTWPYHIYYFDKDETSIFGEGLASIMRDDQDMLNSAVRMMLDNGALTSGPMLEIALGELATVERADEVFPWKIWYRKNGADLSKPAVRQIQLDNNLEFLQRMAQMFDTNTDDVTAIPRYMAGTNTDNGAAGTARGMSMLMGAANIVIKELLNSWDEGVTRTFIEALYRWNMAFSNDAKIKGDFDVKARGTASLVAKEVRAQQLEMFAQQTAQGPDAPFIKRLKLLRQRAEALELSEVVMTEDEWEQAQQSPQAQQAQQMQQQMQQAVLAKAQAEAQKIVAEAQVASTRVQEILKKLELIAAQTINTKVDSIFAALQAGGTATKDPVTAPAGDVVLRSAGYQDAIQSPTISQLDGPPVQQQQSDVRIMDKNQSFATDPRFSGGVTAPAPAAAPAQPQPQAPGPQGQGATQPGLYRPGMPAMAQPVPGVDHQGDAPAAGMQRTPDAHTGERAGIETARIE